MTKYSRRLQKIGSSLLISLPSEWIKNNNLKKGSIIVVEINSDTSISLFPPDIDEWRDERGNDSLSSNVNG